MKLNKMPKFWGIYEITGAGDEILSVDVDKENLQWQIENEYTGDLKLIEIDFTEYLGGLYYLGYDVEWELRNLLGQDQDEDPEYAIVAYGNNWRGDTGTKICQNLSDVFSRSYEATFSDVEVSEDGKYITYRESNHDCPTGALCIVVRLTEYEDKRARSDDGVYEYLVGLANDARKVLDK